MSVAKSKAQGPTLTARDLLAYDERQLIQYLERNRDDDGGFDISDLVGVERLSNSQRNELAGRLG